jgi:PH-interacting protein
MDSKKCKPSTGIASSMNVAPLSVPNQEDEMVRSLKDMVAVGGTDVDIDLREVYFLIMHFLSVGPCQRSFVQLKNELLEHRLLPRRYHAWFSRSGDPGEDETGDDDGISLPLHYNNLVDRYFCCHFITITNVRVLGAVVQILFLFFLGHSIVSSLVFKFICSL